MIFDIVDIGVLARYHREMHWKFMQHDITASGNDLEPSRSQAITRTYADFMFSRIHKISQFWGFFFHEINNFK